MLMRHGDDIDVVAFDRIEQLVRESAQDKTADFAAIDRARKRPRANSLHHRAHLGAKPLAKARNLGFVIPFGLNELAARFWREDEPPQLDPRISSAGMPKTWPDR